MKIMLVSDIAPNSTRDVFDGLKQGLTLLGHEVVSYPTYAYACTMVEPYNEKDPSKLPPHVAAMIWGAIGQMILGAVVLNQPDAVIVVSGWVMPRLVVDAIRAQGIKVALYLTESPYQDAEQVAHESFGAYDVVFCNERGSMGFMAAHHDNAVYLPHSFNPEVHKPTLGGTVDCEIYSCATGFTERISVIEAVDWAGARVKLEGFWPNKPTLKNTHTSEIRDVTVPNHELPAIYSSVPINLNIHRTTRTWLGGSPEEEHITYAESVGPRVFEVLACGGFLLTDYRAELADAGLRDGQELVVFADARDLGTKARWYLQHPDERERIAENGRAAVQSCTFSSRAQQIILPALTGKGNHG